MKNRGYQDQAFWANKKLRRYMLMWLRQGGKTTTLAKQALREMGENKNHLVTFVSASLNIGSEFVEKEAQTWSAMMEDFRNYAEKQKLRLSLGERKTEDADSWKELPEDIDLDAIADAMERSKFEVRLWHSNTVCSRTKVIAPNIATARSWSGTVKFDEVAFVRGLRELLAELEPIFSTDPTFTFLMATTPPPDFAHYAYELMTPANGQDEWPLNADGHWFKNRGGLWVHRVTIDDASLGGRKIYDPETGEEQTPDEARETSLDKEGWDRSNRLKRPLTGTSAMSPGAIDAAQEKGKRICVAAEWDHLPEDWVKNVGHGPIAIGGDPATTEGKKSNPTGIAVLEQVGLDYIARMITWYKIADPQIAAMRVKSIVDALIQAGKRNQIRGAGFDATSELYWCRMLKKVLPIPVTLTSGSSNVDETDIDGNKMNFKQYSCSIVAADAEAGRLILPWSQYIRDDFGRVIKVPGSYKADVGPNGEHADTFDGVRQARVVLQGGGPVVIGGVAVGQVSGWHQSDSSPDDPWWRGAGNKVREFFS